MRGRTALPSEILDATAEYIHRTQETSHNFHFRDSMADSRFTALSTDPRYRLPNRKAGRTAVNAQFKRLFTDQDFRKNARVDRYGRKITSDRGRKELEKRVY